MTCPDHLTEPDDGNAQATPASYIGPAHDHIVHFYETKDTLYRTAGAFLAAGLLDGEAGLVIATQEHGDAIRFQMAALGVDVNAAIRSRELWFMDVEDTLAKVLRNGQLDRGLFEEHVESVVMQSSRSRNGARVRAYGEMVDLLWSKGNTSAAMQLEEWWNEFTNTEPFAILCGYSIGSFYSSARAHGMEDVCRQHGRALPLDSESHNDFLIPLRSASQPMHTSQSDEQELEQEQEQEQDQEQRRLLDHVLREALVQKRRAEEALQRNIADRMRAEVELWRAKEEAERAARARAEFLGEMSRELRTRLDAIITCGRSLASEADERRSDRHNELLQRIRLSAHDLAAVIDDVLYVAQIEAGTTQYEITDTRLVDVMAHVAEIMEPQIEQSGLKFVTDIQESLVVRADAEKLLQILMSVIGNSLKFTAAPGTVRVTAAAESPTGTLAEICISDTGPGIDPLMLDVIFDRFAQLGSSQARARGGLGLGLPISREFARAMNGDLSLESEPGKGATFVLRLPRAARVPAPTSADA